MVSEELSYTSASSTMANSQKLPFKHFSAEDIRDFIQAYISYKSCPGSVNELKHDARFAIKEPEGSEREERNAQLRKIRTAAVNKHRAENNSRLLELVEVDGTGNIPEESFTYIFKDYPQLKCITLLDPVIENLRYSVLLTSGIILNRSDDQKESPGHVFGGRGLNYAALEESFKTAAKGITINGNRVSELILNGCASKLNKEDRKKLLVQTLVELVGQPNGIDTSKKLDATNPLVRIKQALAHIVESASDNLEHKGPLDRLADQAQERIKKLNRYLREDKPAFRKR